MRCLRRRSSYAIKCVRRLQATLSVSPPQEDLQNLLAHLEQGKMEILMKDSCNSISRPDLTH